MTDKTQCVLDHGVPFWPFSRFDHMKPKDLRERTTRHVQANFAVAHGKRDGHCVYVHKDREGLRVVTRTPKRVIFSEGRYPWWDALTERLPYDTELMCELWVPGHPCTNVSSAIAGNEPYASLLRLDVFSVVTWEGTPAVDWRRSSPRDRSLTFGEARILAESVGLSYAPYVHTTSPEFRSVSDVMDHCEGWVFKNTLDQWPRRAHAWRKMKGKMTADLRVVGFEPGQGKYRGRVGSVVLESDDGSIRAKCSGMTDEIRHHMTEYPDWWMGRIVEVEYEVRTPDGNLRHPQYKRWRDDKSSTSES